MTQITNDKTILAEYLTTKFCHDLAGPLGAVNNGAEFLKEAEGEMVEHSTALIEASAKEAIERLLFFRQAYGVSNKHADIELMDVKEVSANFFAQKKITLEWVMDDLFASLSGEMRHRVVKLALNTLMVAAAALPRGGVVKIECAQHQTAHKIAVKAMGEHMKDDPDIEAVLMQREPMPEMNSRNVQLFYTHALIEQMAMHANIARKTGEFLVELKQ